MCVALCLFYLHYAVLSSVLRKVYTLSNDMSVSKLHLIYTPVECFWTVVAMVVFLVTGT